MAAPVQAALARLTEERWASRLWERDGTLWAQAPGDAEAIAYWLGWLDVASLMKSRLQDFEVARTEMGSRYDHVVLAGMGGSSLCPEVFRQTFGVLEGSPELVVLDSTDPATVAAVEARIALDRTLFLIASKSGGTTETISHYRYFHQKARDAGIEHHGRNFVAITDPGSDLDRIATENDFGFVFRNPPDIGGRYSALSYFGMVPAALMGLDVAAILDSAGAMAERCRAVDAASNPGLRLGAVLGVAATSGRDKCTIVCSDEIGSLGMWLEQLLAESTGKQGRGIIPIDAEPLGGLPDYGDDRLFIHIRAGSATTDEDAAMESLRVAGHPVLTIEAGGRDGLGAEFVRWEVATAVAGALIGINPFDQPNVQESKDNTRGALGRLEESGEFGIDLGAGDIDEVEALLTTLQPRDYFAILAYTQQVDDVESRLQAIRTAVRDRHRVATTSGYGPRYLHSTGQLHKGGPNSGVFLILTDETGEDLPIPGEPFGFKTLVHAQSAGDLKSLRDHGRRVAMLPLNGDRLATLDRVLQLVQTAGVAG